MQDQVLNKHYNIHGLDKKNVHQVNVKHDNKYYQECKNFM
jgi:hypothetical protein